MSEPYPALPASPPRPTLEAAHKAAKAQTNDEGKEPLAQLPWAAIRELSKVQAFGHKKYGDFNNYRKGMEVSRQLSCALRHISEYMDGSNADEESGLNPLAHAFCRLAFVLQNIHDGVAIDDRYKTVAAHSLDQYKFYLDNKL